MTLNAMDPQVWELYDLSHDRTETENVIDGNPQLAAELKAEWRAWAERANVLPWPKERQTKK